MELSEVVSCVRIFQMNGTTGIHARRCCGRIPPDESFEGR
jgi:hypothetical protein